MRNHTRYWKWVITGLVVAASFVALPWSASAAGQLVVNLPLDQTNGTNAPDLSANGNNGTLLNGPSWTTGRLNRALSFDGIDDMVLIADAPSLDPPSSGITVSAWIYRGTNENRWVGVVSRQLGNTFYEHYYLGFSDTGQYRWFVNTTSGYSSTGVGGTAPLRQWVHVVGTYDGSFVRLYVNGVQQFAIPHSGTFASDSTGVAIGASHNDAAHTPIEAFNGKIDELRIYNGALSAAEVQQLYVSVGGPALDTPPTVAIASPSGGTLKGSILTTATASDSGGAVLGVQFMVDGYNNGPEDTSAPYSTTIETAAYAEGAHTLSAVARDAAGNVSVSNPVSVIFDNTAVMPLGDSLTAGFIADGDPNNNEGGYRKDLWLRLTAAGVSGMNFVGSLQSGNPAIDPDHEGHGGFTINQLISGVNTWVPASNPDVILLLIGTNDFIQGVTLAQASSRLATLLDTLHSLRPTAEILLATEPGVVPGNLFGIDPQTIVNYNAGMPAMVSARLSQGWKIQLVDLYNLAGLNRNVGSSDYSADGLHLSLSGYGKLAGPWFAALNPVTSGDTTPPTIPSGLSVIATTSSTVDLQWNASTDDLSGVAAYRVYRNAVPITSTSATSFHDTGLAGNTTYSYAVTAVDFSNNESSPSAPVLASTGAPPTDVTPPSVPTGLTATGLTTTSIGLSWTASTDPGPGGVTVSDTFNRANGGLGSTWTGTSGTFQIVNQHVERGAADTLTVARLTTWGGTGDQWAEVTVNVTGAASGGGPVVRVNGAGSNLYLVDYNGRADHKLYRVLGGTFVALGGWTDPASPGDVVRLEAIGTTIRVLVNGVQKVVVSNAEVSGGTPGIYAYVAAGQTVQLDTFAASSAGGGTAVAGYRIFRNGSAVTTSPGTTYTDTGLAANTSYTYTVTAFDGSGNESAPSAPATGTTLTAGAPPVPLVSLAFNEGGGLQAIDGSGNGNSGTLKNGPLWTTGVAGGALQFDGVNDVVEVAPSATINTLTSQVTVAAWVYRAAAQGSWAALVSRQQGTTFFEHFYLGVSDTGQYRWFVSTTNGYSSTALGGAAPVGQWVHVAGTYDGAMIRFYVNGVQQFATAHSGAFLSETTTGLVIGAGYNDAAHTPIEAFNGLLDDVKVYGVALNATQVMSLYLD